MRPWNRRVRGNRSGAGFTLIEMVMVIIILGVLGAIAAPVLIKGVEAYGWVHSSLGTIDKLRYATERLAREIRLTDYNAGAYGITLSAAAPVFTKIDGVTVTVGTGGGNVNLTYSVPAVTAVLTNELSALGFVYYQADGVTAATDATNVRYVEITLTLTNPANGQNYGQRVRVALRDRS
jgi:MSHA biogenesis protein MshO